MSTATPVRPSAFQHAELCGRAPYLGRKYPESSAVMRFGSHVDKQVTKALQVGQVVLDPDEELTIEAEKILAWVEANYPHGAWIYRVQHKVHLIDPTTGEELTAGTPDLIAYNETTGELVVIDWKKRGQLWAGHQAPPDDNLQQLIYLAASWLELSLTTKITTGKIRLACWDEQGVSPQDSAEMTENILFEVIRRVKAVPLVDVEGPEPEAVKGDHCEDCYQRSHCSAYLLPATVALTVGLPEYGEQSTAIIDAGAAARALRWLESADTLLKIASKMADTIRDQVNAYVKDNGPVVVGDLAYQAIPTKGRRTGASIKELEARGLTDMIKTGKPGVKYDWKPIPKDPQ